MRAVAACRLIITADDLGAGPRVDRAVFAAADAGVVRSVSVLVSGTSIEDAASGVRLRPQLSVGLHLAFVQARAVSPAGTLGRLTQSEELPADVFQMILRRPQSVDLLREAEAQLARFREIFGVNPGFVNTHQHAQLWPPALSAIVSLCERHGISRVRLPAERRPIRMSLRPRAWLWPAATAVALLGRRSLSAAGLRFPDRMIGGPESGRLTRASLWPLIEDLPDGITELVVHPVEGGAELAALLDPELLRCLDGAGVVRIAFCDL